MPLTIPTKTTGGTLTAAEFNEMLGAVNDFVDSDYTITGSMVSDLNAVVAATPSVTANTAKNSYPGADSTKVGFLTVTGAIDLDTLGSDVTANNAKVGITAQQASDIVANNAKTSAAGSIATHSDVDLTGLVDGYVLKWSNANSRFEPAADSTGAGGTLTASDIDTLAEINAIITDATLIDTSDARLSDARTPTAHTHTASQITDFDTEVSNNADVTANTAKISYTDGAAVTANTAKVSADGSISTHSDVDLTGVIDGYVLKWNNANSRFEPAADSTGAGGTLTTSDIDTLAELNAIVTDATLIDTGDARLSDARTPTAHTHTASDITDFDTEVSNNADVAANTAKVSYTDAAKVANITVTQAVNLDTIESDVAANTAKTGVTTQISNLVEDTTPQLGGNLDLNGNVITGLVIGTDVQAYSAVLDGTTASFTTADETKLDGIEAAATADQTGAEIKTAYEAEANTNAFTDAEQTKLAGIEALAEINSINSTATGEPTGSDVVLNVVSLTQAEYNAGTPVATTFYIITDA